MSSCVQSFHGIMETRIVLGSNCSKNCCSQKNRLAFSGKNNRATCQYTDPMRFLHFRVWFDYKKAEQREWLVLYQQYQHVLGWTMGSLKDRHKPAGCQSNTKCRDREIWGSFYRTACEKRQRKLTLWPWALQCSTIWRVPYAIPCTVARYRRANCFSDVSRVIPNTTPFEFGSATGDL